MNNAIVALYPSSSPATVDTGAVSTVADAFYPSSRKTSVIGGAGLAPGVRLHEPGATSVTDFAVLFPGGVAEHEKGGLAAAVKMGVGVTEMAAVARLARASIAPGYKAPTADECMTALRAQWGAETEANVAKVRALVAEVALVWPEIFWFLSVQPPSLGNNPAMVRLFHAHAVRSAA